jgi:hypothetical protein
MRARIFYIAIILFVFISIEGISIQQSENNDTTLEVLNLKTQDIIWDIQFSINLTEGTGAEFDGSYFYVTSSLTNFISKYDTAGTLIDTFSVPGVSNLSDITFDGTYMYGGTGSIIIYQMDFITKTLIGTITTPINVRYIAYDEYNDAFWVGSWSDPLVLVTRSGVLLNSFNIGLTFITGTAYDNITSGGPYLWIFDRGVSIPGPQLIHQFHIPSSSFTGLTHDVLSDVGIGQPNAGAGGLFSTADFIQGTFSLGGILIGSPTILFVYELLNPTPVKLINPSANNPSRFILQQNYPNPFNPSTKIKYSIPSVTLRRAQSDFFVSLKVYDVLGNEVATLVNEEKPVGNYEVEFNSATLPSGIYFYQLKAGEFISTKKMLLLK